MPQHGVLNLNKPAGWTSRQVVNVVQRLAKPDKVGHAGTLDPLATGVLVVCVGAATRLIEYVQRMPKTYRGTFLLGRQSPTEDVDGQVTELPNPPMPSRDRIVEAAARLVGQIQQRPPAYSALKVDGRRAYALARKGEHVELKPRPVTVYRIELTAYDYPELTLDVECGSGTYIRSLGRDLAESLGTAAVMSALTRTAIGGFHLAEAIDPAGLTPSDWAGHLQPPLTAVGSLPRIELSAAEATEIRHGRVIRRHTPGSDTPEYAAIDPTGRLTAILISRGGDQLGPKRNLPA